MSKTSRLIVALLLAAGAMAWSLHGPTALLAQDRGGDVGAAVQKLTDRVGALELTVIRDPLRPTGTVLSRLQAIEEKLNKLDKTGATNAKADQRSLDEMRKSMEKVQRQNDELARKLKSLEQDRRGGNDAVAKEAKALRVETDRQQRELNDLKTRVGRLESRK